MSGKVAILMCTYNGQTFITEQLRSFSDQSYTDWDLWVSDDGSSDQTLAIINDFASANPSHSVHIINGPRKGFAKNFLSLILNPDIKAEYFAVSDQDDIWHNRKIEFAVDWLKTIERHIPALYACKVELIDGHGEHIGFSPSCPKQPSFKNALVQNIAGGHAMVMNKAARDLIQNISDVDIPYHDWWFYQCVTGAGGVVYFDDRSLAKYRQHGGNLVGLNASIIARCSRAVNLLKGDYATHYIQNNRALEKAKEYLLPDNQKVLGEFQNAWESGFLKRLLNMLKINVYAQTPIKTVAFWAAVVVGNLKSNHRQN